MQAQPDLLIILPMPRIVLFEDEGFVNFLPLVFWRTIFELRIGRKILLDRTAQMLESPIAGVWTREWITAVAAQRCGAPANRAVEAGHVLVNARWVFDDPPAIPEPPHVGLIDGEPAFVVCDNRLAAELTPAAMLDARRRRPVLDGVPKSTAPGRLIRYPWEIVSSFRDWMTQEWQSNDAVIESAVDPKVITGPRDQVHVGERVTVHPSAIIDSSQGPIYISHDVRIGAYAVIEGPTYLGPGTRIHPHAWLHGGNAAGPLCKLGGEIDGCVIDGYTNKQHAGFLGHAYVGSWVNIGAGTCNSDLKNTYGSVRVPINGTNVDSGDMFVGAFIADHAKIGINASIPTGAVIGLAATVAGTRVLPKFVPSFAWVTDDRVAAGDPARLLDVAAKVMSRRDVEITDEEVELFLDLGARTKEMERRA